VKPRRGRRRRRQGGRAKLDPGVKFDRTEVVNKGQRRTRAIGRHGLVLAALAMLVYSVAVRVEFAIGAIATLVLDTTKMIGFFALFGLDFNLTAIAALLTIIGYSVNDKVVVYDRMRENLRLQESRSANHRHEHQSGVRAIIYTSVAIC
jgi:SecD/SecF fusion protein